MGKSKFRGRKKCISTLYGTEGTETMTAATGNKIKHATFFAFSLGFMLEYFILTRAFHCYVI